jgi:hypothetical protein
MAVLLGAGLSASLLLTVCGGESKLPNTPLASEEPTPTVEAAPTVVTPPAPTPTSTPILRLPPTPTPTVIPFRLVVLEPANESISVIGTITVRGFTVPDAIVSVNGRLVEVDIQGEFAHRVTLEEGPNILEIVANDLQGNQASIILSIIYIAP